MPTHNSFELDDEQYVPVGVNPDGSMEFDIADSNANPFGPEDFLNDQLSFQDPKAFNSNLIESMDDSSQASLLSRLVQTIQQNLLTMQDWLKASKKVRDNLGIIVEDDTTVPFNKAAGVYDNSILVALLSYYASMKSELFPEDGPCSVDVQGNPFRQQLQASQKLEKFFNYYLTKVDEEYYPESSRLLMNVGIDGSIFRKIYVDPITMLPVARTVPVKDLIFDNTVTTLKACSCITQKITYNKKDILSLIASGYFKSIDLDKEPYSDEVEDDSVNSKEVQKANVKDRGEHSPSDLSGSYTVYECHVDLSDADFSSDGWRMGDERQKTVPKPYIVTMLGTSTILSIRRNWLMSDPLAARRKTFVHYKLFPGFGLLGLGLGHIMGSNSIFTTKIYRQVLNAEAMRIFPRGFKDKNIEIKKSSYNIGPSEFADVDTKGRPLAEALRFLELPPSSSMIVQLLGELRERNNAVVVPGNERIPESSYNAPVGTTVALLEEHHRTTSVIIQSLHTSLSEELMLLYKSFSEGLKGPYGFFIQSTFVSISPEDFLPQLQLIPSSNGSVSSFVQNMMKSQAMAGVAATDPGLHDMREVFKMQYEALGIEEDVINKILPPPSKEPQQPAIDPNEVLLTEVRDNMEMARKKHDKEMLELAIEKVKWDRKYILDYQKMQMEYEKNGLTAPSPVNVPMPEVPQENSSAGSHMQHMEELYNQQGLPPAEEQGEPQQSYQEEPQQSQPYQEEQTSPEQPYEEQAPPVMEPQQQ